MTEELSNVQELRSWSGLRYIVELTGVAISEELDVSLMPDYYKSVIVQ